jgi:hypothetical protein
MYPHVGPFTPYFGSIYEGIKSAPTMWPRMSNPLTNPIASPYPFLGIAQAGIVTDHKESLDEYEDYFKGKHNPKMP